jgi:hypothetical protein
MVLFPRGVSEKASTFGWRIGQRASRGNFAAERLTTMPAYNSKSAYHWYLGSRSWREKSQYILERDNHTCQKCLKRRATQVHHLTYKRVFQELPSDLLAVCRQCHAEIHWRQPANDNQIQFVFDLPTAEDKPEDEDE